MRIRKREFDFRILLTADWQVYLLNCKITNGREKSIEMKLTLKNKKRDKTNNRVSKNKSLFVEQQKMYGIYHLYIEKKNNTCTVRTLNALLLAVWFCWLYGIALLFQV